MAALPTGLSGIFQTARTATSGRPRPAFANRLAQALGWTLSDAELRQHPSSTNDFRLSEALVARQPAVVFCGFGSQPIQDAVSDAATFAYHSAVEWGVASNCLETVVFNSHWVKNNSWFQLPSISLRDIESHSHLLEALQPDQVISGNLTRIVLDRATPEASLLAVDDALVDRLDAWRDETLRHTEEFKGIDERLQQLFAQLFVLRVIEDRKLSSSIPPLSTIVTGDDSANKSALKEIFEIASREIQSDLYSSASFRDIPGFILAGIINDLYRPRHLPAVNRRYNFAWLSADVLGRAYEKYLATTLIPSRILDPQLRIWHSPLRGVARTSVQRTRGAYYTPEYVVRFLTEEALDRCPPRVNKKGRVEIPTILDPACGSGSFLTAALDGLIRRLRAIDTNTNWGKRLVDGQHLCGVDIDPRAVTLARLSLWLRLAEEPSPLPLPRLHRSIVVGDSLSATPWEGLPSAFDIVLGNPPFMSYLRAQPREDLAQRFRVAQGRFDTAYLFLELAISKLRVGGQLAMVAPNRVFTARDASTLRAMLADETTISAIVDFESNRAFPGVDAYVALLIAQRGPRATDDRDLRLVRVRRIPPSYPGHLLTLAMRGSGRGHADIEAVDIPHPSGEVPWTLLPPTSLRTRFRMEDLGVPLGDIAAIYQGIKTGANDVFILSADQGATSVTRELQSKLGFRVVLEPELLRPVVFGSDIRRFDLVRTTRFLLYPYLDGEVIPEESLRQDYPLTYRYLSKVRTVLESRSSIEHAGREWYELAWPRSAEWLTRRKLLSKELSTRVSFALDDVGGTFIVGGLGVVPQDERHMLPLVAFLNSNLANWFLRSTAPTFQSQFYKLESQQLQNLPVPRRLFEDHEAAAPICELAQMLISAIAHGEEGRQRELDAELDAAVAQFLGIDQGEL